jgi:GNAT superfamily N-acetyltransferase
MEIQNAMLCDAEEILALQKAAYISEAELHDDFEIPPLTQTIEELISEFEHKKILKITKNGALLASGQARYSEGCCYLGRMAVWPNLWGKGIGSTLLSALESLFPDAKRFELFTGEQSERNLVMYRSRGYVPFKTAQLGKTKVIFLERYL